MIRILFLAANPVDQARLQLRNEFNAVRQVLDAAAARDRFQLIPEFDATPSELQDLLTRHRPQIVHFSGHGDNSGLLFADAGGQSTLVAPETLRDLFSHFADTLHCIVLNACYSQPHAAAIATAIGAVVGMGDAVSDDAAQAFAVAFYRGLFTDKSLATAMALGTNQIDLEQLNEADYPQLQSEHIVPAQIYARDWDELATESPKTAGQTINTIGGSHIGGDVRVDGNMAGRDQLIIHHQTNIFQQAPSATDANEATHFIPFPPKAPEEFVGREDELLELHEKLQQHQRVGVRPATALTGLGGIGKTQLAVAYAYRYQASYPGGIYWINAADLKQLRSNLIETAERMGLRTSQNDTDTALLAALVKHCQRQQATLLIFDNVPDAVLFWGRLTQEINSATLGAALLITTRQRELPNHMSALDLQRLTNETVRQRLLTVRPDLATDPNLDLLLKRVAGLPLVVTLVANALENSIDATIADYLASLAQYGEETVHAELGVQLADYDLYRDVYTLTLLPVLREQWDRLCNLPRSENAQLLLRIAGQLPEAAEIPIARLGLLSGLHDERVMKPLTSALRVLWKLALVEELKDEQVRLHPLVRDFATTLTPTEEVQPFRNSCAERLAAAYGDLPRLGMEYERRGIAALILDLVTTIELCNSNRPIDAVSTNDGPCPGQPTTNDLLNSLQNTLRRLRQESHHLNVSPQLRRADQLWQQLLLWMGIGTNVELTTGLAQLLRQTSHWVPQWGHQHQSTALEQTLVGHEAHVFDIVVVNVNRIVSASGDHTLKVWNLQTGQVEQTLVGHEDSVQGVAVVDANRIVSASKDRTLKVWNLQSGQVEQTLVGHGDSVQGVAVLAANRIVSASADRTLKVWNLQTGQVEQTLVGHEDSVCGVAVMDGNCIVSISWDLTLKIWNLCSGQVEQSLTGHRSFYGGVAVVNANRIVFVSANWTLNVWNLQSGEMEQTLIGHENGVLGVTVLAANRIVVASSDRTLKVWNLQTGQAERTLTSLGARSGNMAMVDANRIVSAEYGGTLKVWNLQSDQVEQAFSSHKDRVWSVFAVDVKCVVSASEDHTLKVWNLQNGRVEKTLIGHETKVRWGAVVDSNRIVSASDDCTLKVWDLQTGQVEQTLTGHESLVLGVTVVNTNRIVSASSDRTLKVWNLQTGQVERTLIGHEFYVCSVAVVDSNRIVSASYDRTLKVWNLQTGTVEQTLVGHESYVLGVAVVDSNRIVSASYDRTLKVWNLQTGAVEQTLVGHKAFVNGVAVVDANRIVSASYDRTLKVWNLQTGQVVASIGLDGSLQCVTVTRQNGRTLVVAGDAGGALYCLELVEPVGQ